MMNRKKIRNLFSFTICLLCLAELLLILSSWLISSAFPDSSVRSLLGSEGVRWLLGHSAVSLRRSSLVWLLLAAISYGVYTKSGINRCITNLLKSRKLHYRGRLSLFLAGTELLFAIIVMLLLTCVPHAILLSVSGDLFPSSFSQSIVPMACMLLLLIGTTSGIVLGTFKSALQWTDAMIYGLRKFSPVILLYIFGIQLVCTIHFVFFM